MLIIRKWFAAALIAALLLEVPVPARAEDAPSVSAGCFVLMHEDGQVLLERNAEKRSLIASTTKIMTAILAIERLDTQRKVMVLPEWCALEGSSMYLKPGEEYTVLELLTGLLLASGNDAAVALACTVSGTVEEFAGLMNEKAAALGLSGSHFANPHGLNAEDHYSTAGDLARLMAFCMKNELFASLAGLRSATVKEQTYVNHNKLLDLCPGCTGGKTGYTELAGRCLVSCCEREGTRLICVTLAAPDDWNDHRKLYDWAYARYGTREVTAGVGFEVPVLSGAARSVRAEPEPVRLFLPKSAALELKAELPFFTFAPVKAGEKAGRVTVWLEGRPLAEARLLYTGDVPLAVPAGR